jgi:hypothetical protein
VERREASVPRHGTQGASLGAWRAALRARPRVFRRAPERLSALRPPLVGVSEAKRQSPDAAMRARERDGLFDMVSRNDRCSLSRVPDAMQRERQRSGASLIRDRHGLERSTQVGLARLAHIWSPISGKTRDRLSAAHHSPSARAALRPGHERRPAFALVPQMLAAAHFGQTNPTANFGQTNPTTPRRSSPRKCALSRDDNRVRSREGPTCGCTK